MILVFNDCGIKCLIRQLIIEDGEEEIENE
jgi:hypothetical protein